MTGLIKKAFKRYFEKGGPFLAAAISYYSFLALVPFLLLLVAVAGFMASYLPFIGIDIEQLLNLMFGEYGEAAFSFASRIMEQRFSYGIAGLVGLFLAFSFVITPVSWALKQIFGEEKSRSFLYLRLVSFLIFIVILIAGVSVTVGATLFQTLVYRFSFNRYTFIYEIVFSLLAVVLFSLVVFLLINLLPHEKTPLKPTLIGSVLTGFLMELSRIVFLIYLRYFPFYDVIYGAVSFIFVIIIFIYLTSSIFIYGASFISVLIEEGKVNT